MRLGYCQNSVLSTEFSTTKYMLKCVQKKRFPRAGERGSRLMGSDRYWVHIFLGVMKTF